MNSDLISIDNFKKKYPDFLGDVLTAEPLSKHTYYKIGGPAKLLITPRSLDDLVVLSRFLKEHPMPFFVIGAGSNLLVADCGFDGLIIKTTKFNQEIFQTDSTSVTVGASVLNSVFLRRSSIEGWGGVTFLAGIPGSIGGAAFMNAGTFLGEFKDSALELKVYNLETAEFRLISGDDLIYRYRKNLFLNSGDVVTSVKLIVKSSNPDQVKQDIDGILLRRKQSQPIELPSCGSVFKNPLDSHIPSAWAVIERLGLRGYRIGNACLSEKHCNFIVNLGGATAQDVVSLIELVKNRAWTELAIKLEEEVRYLGF